MAAAASSRTGASTDDAKDLTQAFFTRVLEKGYFKEARQERGRFRAFLLTAVKRFLINADAVLLPAQLLPC